MTLLNIEDHATTQETFTRLLEKLSEGRVMVYSALSLSDGLRIAHENHPEVVLLDLLLPDSPDWHNTVAKIPEFPKGSPVIAVTNLDVFANDYEIYMACVKAGARRVFQKPQLNKILAWLGEGPLEDFAARLLGEAGAIHIRDKYGPHES